MNEFRDSSKEGYCRCQLYNEMEVHHFVVITTETKCCKKPSASADVGKPESTEHKKVNLYFIVMDWNKSFNITKNVFNNTPASVYLFSVAL